VAQRGSRPTRDERRSGSGSLTHADELRMATPATSSTLVEWATQKHGRAAGYHPRRGGRYDSREDRSPTPEPPGTGVFSREIRTVSFPQRFR
jgi:hypothetical protein